MFDIARRGAVPLLNFFRQAAHTHDTHVAVLRFYEISKANWFPQNTSRKNVDTPHSHIHLSTFYTQTHAQYLSYLDVVLDAVLVLAQALTLGPALLH
jgi:uncharacterized protein YfbU (UPF0304 family)